MSQRLFGLPSKNQNKSLCSTLRSGLHEIPSMIHMTFPHGLENNHACKWNFDNFPGMLTFVFFLENEQKNICMHWYSPINVDRSSRVSNLGDKSVCWNFMESASESATYTKLNVLICHIFDRRSVGPFSGNFHRRPLPQKASGQHQE